MEGGAPEVLVVDDEEAIRAVLEYAVKKAGGVPFSVSDVPRARAMLDQRPFACALVDKNVSGESGIQLLQELRRTRPNVDVIVITGHANVDSAIEALRLGALDYIVKPFDLESIVHRITLALERRRVLAENARMQTLLLESDRLASIGTLAAGVAHEINNPLSFVLTNVQLLEEELPGWRGLRVPRTAAAARSSVIA
jgi:DNA-binding NtrC family response regulator